MYGRKYSQEEIDFLIVTVPGHSYKEIIELFYKKFDVQLSSSQVKSFIGNRKLNTGRDGRFEKGHVPANKGKKGGGWEPTQYKKGNTPWNYRPVGSERIDVNGYTLVKIADPKTWRMKHVLVWEGANGSVPKGYVVIFGDGNKRNFELNNLILVSKKQLAVLNHKGLIQNDAELTKTGIVIADIYSKINQRKKKIKKKEETV